jgi:hypothetical protein
MKLDPHLTGGNSRISTIWAAAAITAITIAVYWPALGSGFVGDDFMILHRLRGLTGPADVFRYFRGEFFEYYRPLGFVSHAVDWAIAGQNARQFHLTNLLIHAINTLLVLLIGRSLSPRSLAGPLAAALFALHASNNEAVVWMSARFDLLATCFALAAVCWMVRRWAGTAWVPSLFFFPALLSKEAAVALPLARAGWSTFVEGSSTIKTIVRLVPWLVVLGIYSALRSVAGGVSAVGGASRLPKLIAFGASLALVVALSDGRWEKLRDWLRTHRVQCAALFVAGLTFALLVAVASDGRPGALAREKLSVAGFALFYLASPWLGPGEAVFTDSSMRVAWLSGAVALLLAGALLFRLWEMVLTDRRIWFLAAFLCAALLPVSALTEGKRYLYLPSAAVSLIAGILIAELPMRLRRMAFAAAVAVIVASTIQIVVKEQDWRWAGAMTAEGARLVDSALAPSCGTGHVVFLTSPVAVRSVYSHFYYETFEVPRGCMPEVFQVVARVLRVDTRVAARWDGPSRIVVSAPGYRDNFALSRDLRAFDVRFRTGDTLHLATPLGVLDAESAGDVAELTLTLTPEAQRERIHFFYYSDGQIRPLEPRQ